MIVFSKSQLLLSIIIFENVLQVYSSLQKVDLTINFKTINFIFWRIKYPENLNLCVFKSWKFLFTVYRSINILKIPKYSVHGSLFIWNKRVFWISNLWSIDGVICWNDFIFAVLLQKLIEYLYWNNIILFNFFAKFMHVNLLFIVRKTVFYL